MTGIVINLPYGSGTVPPALLKRLPFSGDEWRLEHWRLIDPHLAALVREASVYQRRSKKIRRQVVDYPVSPLVADPWGLWAEELGESASPAGPPPGPAIIPRSTSGKSIAWREKDRELIFGRTVWPFYGRLEKAVEEALIDSPLVLVLTIRSFSSIPFKFEKNQKYPRPQVSITTDLRATPEGLARLAGNSFQAFRWWPERNWPYPRGACFTPVLRKRPRVKALGLGLNRNLYMDEKSGRLFSGAKGVVRVLTSVFNLLDQELARVARVRIERFLKPNLDSPVIKAANLKKEAK